MKYFKSTLIMIFLIFLCFEILTESNSILNSVTFSLDIFKKNIFPSLFPFFVLSNLMIKYGFVELIGNFSKGFMNKLFKINGKCAFIFIMSIISGNPSNAKYTRELYLNNDINKYEATKILSYSCFASPLFILVTTTTLLGNKKIGFLILICHYLSNIIIGIILRFYHPSKKEDKTNLKYCIRKMHEKRISNKENFGQIITNSLIESINNLLLIMGVITISLVLTTIIDNNISLNSTLQSILNGFIEMTQGLKYISIEPLSLKLKTTLFTMILSFGGLSVHMQIMSILSDTDIKYLPFLISRIVSSLISSLLIFILFDFYIIY